MSCADGHCVTCADEAIPMRVLQLDDARRLALCENREGRHSTVETELVAPVAVGDTVLVHAAVALVKL